MSAVSVNKSHAILQCLSDLFLSMPLSHLATLFAIESHHHKGVGASSQLLCF